MNLIALEYLLRRQLPKDAVRVKEPETVKVDADVRVEVIENEMHVDMVPLDYESLLRSIKQSTDRAADIVDWMLDVTALQYIAQYTVDAYKQQGGEIVFSTNDGYIPGISLDEWVVFHQPGSYVVSKKEVIVMNTQENRNYAVSLKARSWLPDRNTLLFFIRNYIVQWLGKLLKFRRYAKLPTDVQFPINVVISDYGKVSIPFVAKYSSPRILGVVFSIGLQTYEPVKPKLVLMATRGDTTIYEIDLPRLNANRQYKLVVFSRDVPRNGYVEFYADGVSRGPTILYWDLKVLKPGELLK